MLVLLRKVGEEIVIKDDINVRVVRVAGNRAFLAIEAPAQVLVDREEVWLAKKRERLAASGCESAKKTAGPEELRQSRYDRESVQNPATDGVPFVRRSISMPNRVTGEECPEDDPADHDDHCRVFQPGVPPGSRLDAPGLRAAVNRLIAACEACDGPEIEFWDDLAACDELPPELQSAALSIVQELLLNACRHSKSNRVLLALAQDDGCLCVQVQDWGIGFDSQSEQSHQRGLKGVRDLVGWLGGTLDIDSQRGKGACVIVEVPLSRATGTKASANDPKPR